MSLLTRISAPAAGHDLAALVAALLSGQPGAPRELPGAAADPPAPPARPVDPPAPSRLITGPTGLGTSAARIGPAARGGPAARSGPAADRGPVARGGAAPPELYCPPAIRDDPALGELVNDRLVAWAEQVGIYPGQLDKVRAANFGRLIMLTHPETEDPDRLLAAAKCALAEWAVDDHYCDDESVGADPALLGSRLGIATAAIDPAHPPARYAPELEQAMQDDPVRVALRGAFEHLAQYASPAQVQRLRHEIAGLFLGFDQEATWRTAGQMPAVWEYLAHRQLNSFLPCMALIDMVGGYQLPTEIYSEPRVRRAITMAATASALVNDLYSMAKEHEATGQDFNLPTVIAAEEQCALEEAVTRSVELHDELVHAFEAEAAALSLAGSPLLGRFLAGVWAWMGGNREWHRSTRWYGDTEPAPA